MAEPITPGTQEGASVPKPPPVEGAPPAVPDLRTPLSKLDTNASNEVQEPEAAQQPEQSREQELTPEQEERLKQIMTVRGEIRLFDSPPPNPYLHEGWLKNRPYQTREEAVQAFADLTSTTPQKVNELIANQKAAYSSVQYWDEERRWSTPWSQVPSANWQYFSAHNAWSQTLTQERELINDAVRGFKREPVTPITPITTPIK